VKVRFTVTAFIPEDEAPYGEEETYNFPVDIAETYEYEDHTTYVIKVSKEQLDFCQGWLGE